MSSIWPESLTATMNAAVKRLNDRWRAAGSPVPRPVRDEDDRDHAEYLEEMSLGGETFRPYNGPYSGARGGQNR